MRSQLLLRRRPFAPRAGSPQQQQQPPSDKVARARGEQQQQSISSPFDKIQRIRKVKKAGIGLSAAALVGSAAAAVAAGSGSAGGLVSFQPELLDAIEAAATVSAALVAATGLSLAAAKLSLGERLHLEVEGPRLFVEVLPEVAPSPPSSGSSPPSPSSSSGSSSSSLRPDGRPHLVVRDAGDGRGRGVYVRERTAGAEGREQPLSLLPRGSFLGCYEGDLLSERAFWERYPGGVGDYCIGCGGGFCLDGAPLARELLESSGGGGGCGKEEEEEEEELRADDRNSVTMVVCLTLLRSYGKLFTELAYVLCCVSRSLERAYEIR